jgi:rhodanese-related sulfurtransferase
VKQVGEKLSKDFPENDFLKLFNRKKPTHDTPLIFMCKIGKRSQNALEVSRQLGYKK